MNERTIKRVFVWSIVLKGLHAIFEVVGGTVLFFVSTGFIYFVAQVLTRIEISEDPNDFISNYLLQSAQSFTIGAKTFIAIYLLSHGIVKLFLVYNLLKNRLWAYPLSLAVFGLFIAYQIYRFTYTHSIVLVLLTIFDLAVMWLIWHEYKRARALSVATT